MDIELNTKDTCRFINKGSKEDNTNIVQLITQQCFEKLEVTKNNILKVQEEQKDTYDKKHALAAKCIVAWSKSYKEGYDMKERSWWKDGYSFCLTMHMLLLNICLGKGIYSLQGTIDPSQIIRKLVEHTLNTKITVYLIMLMCLR